jgi:hypothetical protein
MRGNVVNWTEIAELVTARRPIHLVIATGTCLANFSPASEWAPNGRSDRYWLEVLSDPERKISNILIRDFINQYTLHRQGRWTCKDVRDQLSDFGRGRVGLPNDVQALAQKLAGCVPPRKARGSQREHGERAAPAEQHSAASKFAFFSQPAADHHIFDSVVRVALRGRGSGSKVPATYAKFFPVVSQEYQKELEDAEFNAAFADYDARQIGMPVTILSGFHRRYFFDKFLLAQGVFVQAELDRRKAGHDPESAPRRKGPRPTTCQSP